MISRYNARLFHGNNVSVVKCLATKESTYPPMVLQVFVYAEKGENSRRVFLPRDWLLMMWPTDAPSPILPGFGDAEPSVLPLMHQLVKNGDARVSLRLLGSGESLWP